MHYLFSSPQFRPRRGALDLVSLLRVLERAGALCVAIDLLRLTEGVLAWGRDCRSVWMEADRRSDAWGLLTGAGVR